MDYFPGFHCFLLSSHAVPCMETMVSSRIYMMKWLRIIQNENMEMVLTIIVMITSAMMVK